MRNEKSMGAIMAKCATYMIATLVTAYAWAGEVRDSSPHPPTGQWKAVEEKIEGFGGIAWKKNPDGKISLWFIPDENSDCTEYCWEQWGRVTIHLTKQGTTTERERLSGEGWPDKFGNPQRYGRWGRDKPIKGSCCFRLDDIPGEKDVKGIHDQPGYHDKSSIKEVLKSFSKEIVGIDTFTLRFHFDMVSALWCKKKLLGYYRWSANQIFTCVKGMAEPKYEMGDAEWHEGGRRARQTPG